MGMVFGLIDVHNFKLLNNETRDYLHECIKLDIHKKHDKRINPITPLKSAFFGVMDSRAEAVKQINEFDKQTSRKFSAYCRYRSEGKIKAVLNYHERVK